MRTHHLGLALLLIVSWLPLSALAVPKKIDAPVEKVIIVDPRTHTWGAYDASGNRLGTGTATAGGKRCPEIKRGCRTAVRYFRIYSHGSPGCKSTKHPRPRGGAPMPYCMFFNGGQGLHGSYEVVKRNVSHGCVRVTVSAAKWIRFNFATIGT